MSFDENNIPHGVTEETERLICRRLDGEITVAEQARLDQLLAASEPARRLLAEYERNDAFAAAAMRYDLASYGNSNGSARTTHSIIPFRRRFQPYFTAAAAALLTTAAVLIVSVLLQPDPRGTQLTHKPVEFPIQQAAPSPAFGPSMLVDYRDVDHSPRQYFDNVYRDFIGIRGSNPNVIYVFERESQATQGIPVRGDF